MFRYLKNHNYHVIGLLLYFYLYIVMVCLCLKICTVFKKFDSGNTQLNDLAMAIYILVLL